MTNWRPARHPQPPRGLGAAARPLLLLVALLGGWLLVRGTGVADAAQVPQSVRAAGAWGPVVFAGVYGALTLLPVPKNVLTAAGAALFGFAAGSALAWLAAMAGAVVAFALGRALGRDAVERLLRARLTALDAVVARRGVWAVLLVRLVPVVPFTAVNYGSGLTGVTLRAYVVGSAVGMVPGTIAYAALGAYAGTNPSAVGAGIAGLVVLALGGGAAARWLARRQVDRAGRVQGTGDDA